MMRLFAKITSLFFSTVVIIALFLYQCNSDFIKAKFFKHLQSRKVKENQSDYFKRIGKTNIQIKFDKYTTIGLNVLFTVPCVFSIITKHPIMYITYAGSIMFSSSMTAFGKKIFKETRPDDKNDLTSFPSGHSAFAFTAASVFLLCVRKKKHKAIFGCLSVLAAIFIAIGRVLANRHWPIDVLAGMTIGCLSGSLSYLVTTKINSKMRLFKYNDAVVDKSDI